MAKAKKSVAAKKTGSAKARKRSASTGGRQARSKGLAELLGRALVDTEFRCALLADPQSIARQHGLSPEDTDALKKVDGAKLEQAASEVAARPNVTVGVSVTIRF